MKSRAFFRRGRLLLGMVVGFTWSLGNHSVVMATSALASYTGGPVTTAPQVDATNFYNSTTWSIFTTLPYRTANTLNYFNDGGSMYGIAGWDFEWYPSGAGVPHPSATFTNGNYGVIYGDPYLLVSATNLVNKGRLNSSASGKIQLFGSYVSLARSYVQIQPLVSIPYAYSGQTNFFGDVGVYDQAWGLGTNYFKPQDLLQNVVYNPPIVTMQSQSPTVPQMTDPCGRSRGFTIGATNNAYLDNTNSVAGTNVITGYSDWTYTYDKGKSNCVVQVVIVRVADTNLVASIRFSPSSSATNIAQTASVLITASLPNPLVLSNDLSTLCLDDTVVAETYGGLALNSNANQVASCTGSTYRPANYVLNRTVSTLYTSGLPGYGTPTNAFFLIDNFINQVVVPAYPSATVGNTKLTNGFKNALSGNLTGYSAYVDNLAAEPPQSANPSLTNFPGEVRIYATNLDLTLARIRGEGELLIQTAHLIPYPTNWAPVVDCPNLGYNLGSTNGFLHLLNLAHTNSYRLNGTLNVVDAVWKDSVTTVNSNTIAVTFHYLIVDAGSLSSQIPVLTYDLLLHATNILVSDQVAVQQNLLLDGKSFTLDSQGSMSLTNSHLSNWIYTNMPGMRYFTNNGGITVAQNAHFGDDGPTNLAVFVNTGSIVSSGLRIGADYLMLNGINDAGFSGEFDAYCKTGVVNGAGIYDYVFAGANLQFFANSLTITNRSYLVAYNTLNFFVTNNLTDGGLGAGNIFYCANGFNLPVKPAAGDLLGTTIQSYISGGAQVDHTWAGHDYGRNAFGYLNNVAVGTLKLTAKDTSQYPLFNFVGAGSQNALYVDTLDVTNLTSGFANYLQIAGNMKIYYNRVVAGSAASLTSASAANPGLLNGQLIWMGSTNATTNIIFGASSQPSSSAGFKLSANGVLFPGGLAASNVIILSSTNLLLPMTNWTPIYTGTPPFTFTDSAVSNQPAKFYRAKQGW